MSERACEAAYGCTERGECYAETVGVQAHCGGVPSGSSVPEAARAAALGQNWAVKSLVDRISVALMQAWEKAEPDHMISNYPASFVATFVDMARAVEPIVAAARTMSDALQVRSTQLAQVSSYITGSYPSDIDPEAILWRRIAKIGEEHGEVIAALIGAIGENPRKGVTHTMEDVQAELLDVAVCALAAFEHTTGNQGLAVEAMLEKIGFVAGRLGCE